MIKARLAKSKLENEEGMNHMWIQLNPLGNVDNVRVRIILPTGIHRLHNLGTIKEEQTGELLILNPDRTNDIFLEIFTHQPVVIGEKAIIIVMTYKDEFGNSSRMEYSVILNIVNEDEMEGVVIDEEVVSKVKEMQKMEATESRIDFMPSKFLLFNSNHRSDLEKKYWIEGSFQVK